MVAMESDIKHGQLFAVDNAHTRVIISLHHAFCKLYGYIIVTVNADLLDNGGLKSSFIWNFYLLVDAVKGNSFAIVFTAWYYGQLADPCSFSLIIDAINEQGIDGDVLIADQVEG